LLEDQHICMQGTIKRTTGHARDMSTKQLIYVNSDSSEVFVALKIVLVPEKKKKQIPYLKVYHILLGQRTI